MFSVMSVCLSVYSGYNFEPLHIETSFLVCRYIFTISRLSLSIKVTGSKSRSNKKNDNFTYLNMLLHCMWLQVINMIKFTYQGEGHIKVKVKISNSFQFYVIYFAHVFTLKGLNGTNKVNVMSRSM